MERARKAAAADASRGSQRKLRRLSLFAKPGNPGRTLQHVYSGISSLRRQSMRRQASNSADSATTPASASASRSPSPPVWARVPGLLARKTSSRGATPASVSSDASAGGASDGYQERVQPMVGADHGAVGGDVSAEDSSSSDSG